MTKNLFQVEADVLKSVAKTFNKTEELLSEDVKTLKKWLKTQPHLPEIMDDKLIQNFLILNKCNLERTKVKLDMYYTIRTRLGDIFENCNPKLETMKEVMEILYLVPLPILTKEMCRVFVIKTRKGNLIGDLEPYNILRHAVNVQEIRIKEDVAFGDIFIADCTDVSLKFLLKVTPKVLVNFLNVYQKVFSLPLKAVYILNASTFIKTIIAIIKTLLKPKLLNRIHICKNSSFMTERIPKEVLPKDYGGDGQSLEETQEILKSKFLQYQGRFDQLDQMRVDETLRPFKLESCNNLINKLF